MISKLSRWPRLIFEYRLGPDFSEIGHQCYNRKQNHGTVLNERSQSAMIQPAKFPIDRIILTEANSLWYRNMDYSCCEYIDLSLIDHGRAVD